MNAIAQMAASYDNYDGYYLNDNEHFFLIEENGELSVGEVMTPLRWNPSHPNGFQWDGKRRIALTSYGAFGSDCNRARMCADRWCKYAERAWHELDSSVKVVIL